MVWDWLPEYLPKFVQGLWITIELFTLSLFFGFLMAIPIGLVQVILYAFSRNTTINTVVVIVLRTGFRVPLLSRFTRVVYLACFG